MSNGKITKESIMAAVGVMREHLKMTKAAFVPVAAMPPPAPPPGAMPPGGAPPPGGAMPPGGAPPMDPAMAGGGGMPPGGAPPMDPAMAGGAPPMDPAMAGGAPPMDPAMAGGAPPPGAGGPPPEGGGGTPVQVNMEDLMQLFKMVQEESGSGSKGGDNEPQTKVDDLSDQVTDLGTKVDKIIDALTGGEEEGAAAGPGEAGAMPPGLAEVMAAGPAAPMPPLPPAPPIPAAPPMAPMSPMTPMGAPMTPVAGGAMPPMEGMMPQASTDGMNKSAAASIAYKVSNLAASLRKKAK